MQGDEPEEIGEPAQPAVEVIHEGLQVAETVESHAPEVRLIEIEGVVLPTAREARAGAGRPRAHAARLGDSPSPSCRWGLRA